ncbi:unnamed protein product [Phaeothamnion confervicola]
MAPQLLLACAAIAGIVLGALSFGGTDLFARSAPPFGMYILALSWKAEWCYHSPFPGCLKPEPWWRDHLTMHGLWPDNGDGTYPSFCTKEPFDHNAVVSAIGIEALEQYWPNVQKAEGSRDYIDFWSHEWTKHGTCTGLKQVEYFGAAMALLEALPTPAVISGARGGTVARADIEAVLGGTGMAILNCEHGKYLSQVKGRENCAESSRHTMFQALRRACVTSLFRSVECSNWGEIIIAASCKADRD